VPVLKRRVLQRLRLIGAIEGCSTLLLFFVAMPLKYLADQPSVVSVMGPIHGGLFVIYCVVLGCAMKVNGRPIKWAIKLIVAAVVPFGPFVADRGLKNELAEMSVEE